MCFIQGSMLSTTHRLPLAVGKILKRQMARIQSNAIYRPVSSLLNSVDGSMRGINQRLSYVEWIYPYAGEILTKSDGHLTSSGGGIRAFRIF